MGDSSQHEVRELIENENQFQLVTQRLLPKDLKGKELKASTLKSQSLHSLFTSLLTRNHSLDQSTDPNLEAFHELSNLIHKMNTLGYNYFSFFQNYAEPDFGKISSKSGLPVPKGRTNMEHFCLYSLNDLFAINVDIRK